MSLLRSSRVFAPLRRIRRAVLFPFRKWQQIRGPGGREFLTAEFLSWADRGLGGLRSAARRPMVSNAHAASSRFARIESRPWSSDLGFSRPMLAAIQDTKQNQRAEPIPPIHWKGVLLMKDPFSLASYPILLQELRPRTVIELGAFHGGSALWLADLLETFGVSDASVHSFDIDTARICAAHPRVTFHFADAYCPSEPGWDSHSHCPSG